MHDQVLERDGRCVRCDSTERLQVHHVVGAEHAGPTTMENLITLCADCHIVVEREKRLRQS